MNTSELQVYTCKRHRTFAGKLTITRSVRARLGHLSTFPAIQARLVRTRQVYNEYWKRSDISNVHPEYCCHLANTTNLIQLLMSYIGKESCR